jgi:hypothetical protein
VRGETSLDDGLNYTAGSSCPRYDYAVFRRRVGFVHLAEDFISNLTLAAKGCFQAKLDTLQLINLEDATL